MESNLFHLYLMKLECPVIKRKLLRFIGNSFIYWKIERI